MASGNSHRRRDDDGNGTQHQQQFQTTDASPKTLHSLTQQFNGKNLLISFVAPASLSEGVGNGQHAGNKNRTGQSPFSSTSRLGAPNSQKEDNFLAKCLLEKLLREYLHFQHQCHTASDSQLHPSKSETHSTSTRNTFNIGTIYLLLLSPDSVSQELDSKLYLKEMFESPLFDTLRNNFNHSKSSVPYDSFEDFVEGMVQVVQANIVASSADQSTHSRRSLNFADMKLHFPNQSHAEQLREEVNMVMHCASHHSRLMIDGNDSSAKNPAAAATTNSGKLKKKNAQSTKASLSNSAHQQQTGCTSLAKSFFFNILGSIQLLNSCKEFSQLEVFTYVSSCFVNCDKKSGSFVREEIYPLRLPRNQSLEDFVEDVAEHYSVSHGHSSSASTPLSSAAILKMLKFPNSYTLSKRIAELLINRYRENVSVCVVRPSIIGASLKGPVRGWIDPQHVASQSFGSASIYMLVGLGMIRVIPGNSQGLSDQIPVDFVVNALLLCSARMAETAKSDTSTLKVYQVSSSASKNACTWADVTRGVLAYWQAHPPRLSDANSAALTGSDALSSHPRAELHMVSNKNWYYASLFMSKPSWMTKSYEYVAGKISKPSRALLHEMQTQADQLWRGTRNQSPGSRSSLASNGARLSAAFVNDASFHYFTLNEWTFDNRHVMDIYENLPSSEEREVFNLDIDSVDWDTYFQYFCYGLHRFILREDNLDPPVFNNLLMKENEYSLIPLSAAAGSFVPLSMVSDLSFVVYANSVFNSSKTKIQFMKDVLESSVVQKAIQKEMKELSCSRAQVEKRAHDIMDVMFADPQMKYVRLCSYLLRKVWRIMYKAIFVDTDEISMIRRIAAASKGNGTSSDTGPLILLPTHRSYIDFLILSFVCFAYDLPIPHIAAGEDFLGMFGVRKIFRHSGAFFLRRSFQDDFLYKSIFQEYVQELLADGAPLEFFVEGTRSRGGKTLQPKLGLLSIICDTYLTKRVSNLTVVPINISYEKVLERESYSYELLGEKKTPETLANLLKNVYSVLSKSYGSISVSFSKPIRMNQYMEEMSYRFQKWGCLSLSDMVTQGRSAQDDPNRETQFSPATNIKHKKLLVQQLASNIAFSLDQVSIIMPTALLATIVLQYRNGISKDHLTQHMLWLKQEILRRNGRLYWSSNELTSSVLDRCLTLMKNEIHQRKHMIEPAVRQNMGNMDYKKFIQLHCYRNQLIHLFVREAIVACAFGACIDQLKGESDKQQTSHYVTRKHLIKEAQFIHDIMKVEFIHNPDDPEIHFTCVIDKMVQRGILKVLPQENCPPAESNPGSSENTTPTDLSNGESARFNDDDCIAINNMESFQFFRYMLWPFIDTYWIAVQSILSLTFPGGRQLAVQTGASQAVAEKSRPADRTILHERIQWLAEKCFFNGQILFYESCSLDTIKNSVSALIALGVLEKVGRSHVQLTNSYNHFEELSKFSDRILKFRKLGKQRKMVMPLAKL